MDIGGVSADSSISINIFQKIKRNELQRNSAGGRKLGFQRVGVNIVGVIYLINTFIYPLQFKLSQYTNQESNRNTLRFLPLPILLNYNPFNGSLLSPFNLLRRCKNLHLHPEHKCDIFYTKHPPSKLLLAKPLCYLHNFLHSINQTGNFITKKLKCNNLEDFPCGHLITRLQGAQVFK